jgi:hypothetical protein
MAREHLARGRALVVTTAGFSMWPLLRPGARVTIVGCAMSELRRGDVVLLAAEPSPVLHRVVALRPDAVLTKGDNARHTDGWSARDAVLGRLERRPWDPAVARASRPLSRPVALAFRLWRALF